MTNRLEIDGPTAECGNCRFSSKLDGNWIVVDGVLVFKAMPDPLQRRGPSLHTCGECGTDFDVIETDGAPLARLQQKIVRATARMYHVRIRREDEDDAYL